MISTCTCWFSAKNKIIRARVGIVDVHVSVRGWVDGESLLFFKGGYWIKGRDVESIALLCRTDSLDLWLATIFSMSWWSVVTVRLDCGGCHYYVGRSN